MIRARELGALALLVGVGACASPRMHVWNLQQVHGDDGSASYSGNLRTGLEALLLGGDDLGVAGATSPDGPRLPSAADIFGIEGAANEKIEAIEDPYGVAMENVIALASMDPTGDEELRALQVETLGWLAGDSAFPLVRERATLALGKLGRILELEELVEQLAPEDALGANELLDLLRPVISAARGEGDLIATATALHEARLDRDGLRRAVRTVTILRFGGRKSGGVGNLAKSQAGQILQQLHDDLQSRLVAQSLSAALDNPNAEVRAAAIQASVVATDNSLPSLIQGAVLRSSDEVVIVRAIELLGRFGIPKWDGAKTTEEEQGYRDSWSRLCVSVLRNAFEGPVAISAAQTLAKLEPEGPRSLRPEDWVKWYDERTGWSAEN